MPEALANGPATALRRGHGVGGGVDAGGWRHAGRRAPGPLPRHVLLHAVGAVAQPLLGVARVHGELLRLAHLVALAALARLQGEGAGQDLRCHPARPSVEFNAAEVSTDRKLAP